MRDGVWTRGENTELEVWIGGQARAVVVTSEAIEHYLALTPEEAAIMSANERRKFVRDNISVVVAAANRNILANVDSLDMITIRSGELRAIC
jgi:hypothetical protein